MAETTEGGEQKAEGSLATAEMKVVVVETGERDIDPVAVVGATAGACAACAEC